MLGGQQADQANIALDRRGFYSLLMKSELVYYQGMTCRV